MSRRLVRAVLPIIALTATAAGAQDGMTVIAGAEGTPPTFAAGFGAAHGALTSSDLSLDGRAFMVRDDGQAGLSTHFAALGDDLPGLQGEVAVNAAQALDGARHASARPVTVSPSKVARLPEPATWAMMIIGFGLIGGAVRRGLRKSDERFNDYIRSITDNPDA